MHRACAYIDGHLDQFFRREWDVETKNLFFVFPLGKSDFDLRLEARLNVFRHFIGRSVVIHRAADSKIVVRENFQAGDHALDVTALIQKRRERRP